jgi:hypothetical protein
VDNAGFFRSIAAHEWSNESNERRHPEDQRIVCQIIDDRMAAFNSLERNGIAYFEMNGKVKAGRLKRLYFDCCGVI